MERTTALAVWSWLVVALVLEVLADYSLKGAYWMIRDSMIALIAISAAAIFALSYLGLKSEHLGIKMLVLVGIWFSMDLVLIWTASLVH
jgi:hypothetical protein